MDGVIREYLTKDLNKGRQENETALGGESASWYDWIEPEGMTSGASYVVSTSMAIWRRYEFDAVPCPLRMHRCVDR